MAYVTTSVGENSKETSRVNTFTIVEYAHFSPINPTTQYTLIID